MRWSKAVRRVLRLVEKMTGSKKPLEPSDSHHLNVAGPPHSKAPDVAAFVMAALENVGQPADFGVETGAWKR